MSPSFTARKSGRAGGARVLALLLSWLLATSALPTGSLSKTSRTASQGATDSLNTSGEEAAATINAAQATTTPDEATQARVSEAYGNLSLRFEANQGQTDQRVKFLARGGGYHLFLTSTEAVMVLTRPAVEKEKSRRDKASAALRAKTRGLARSGREALRRASELKEGESESAVLRMKLEGANSAAQAEGMEELPGRTNYFIGNDPQKWRTDIPSYARVMYREIYPGIDMVYYGQEQQLEYDFVVAPGVDHRIIELAFEGAQAIETDAQGDLVLHTRAGDARQRKPLVYQEVDGARREIESRYVVKDGQRVGFQVEAYDRSKPLVIDPVLSYSTYLGGSSNEDGNSIAIDAAGNAYVTGRTTSFDFPLENPIQDNDLFSTNAFVSKLNADGSALIYSTYLGGIGSDTAFGIAVDSAGSAFVTGFTFSPDFPLMNPAQAALGGKDDAFVTKLNPQGSALIYSTFLGGRSFEISRGLSVDADGNAYVTGFTNSQDLPTANPLQAAKGGDQAFKSTNSGGNWSVSDTGLDVSLVSDLAIDPAHPSTLYAATELGVYKSTDSGSTWNAINNGLVDVLRTNGDANRLVVDPVNTSNLYVATFNGIYKSTNGGNSWTPSFGGDPGAFFIADALAIDPSNPNILYAGVNGFSIRSTDAGGSWEFFDIISEFGFAEYITAFAIDPTNSSIIYAGAAGSGVYKSTDGGTTWQLNVAGLPGLDDFSFFVLELIFNPANPSTIYATTIFHGILKSTNGGHSWSAANNGLPDRLLVQAVAVDPQHPNTLYASTNGSGLFKSTNAGGSWSPSQTGLTNRDVVDIVIDPADTSKVYAVTSSDSDAFITKLNPAGSSLLYSTYLGGSELDSGRAISVGLNGSPYVTGLTASTNFPVENPIQGSFSSPDSSTADGFVTKLAASGTALAYSTYLGGTGDEQGTGIAIDRQGNAYVTGTVAQFDPDLPMTFPTTPGAFQTAFHDDSFSDAFVTKINAAGSNLIYSTYLGGNNPEFAFGIAVNSAGQAFVTGQTFSQDFPLALPTQGEMNGTDAFVTRLNAAGSALVFSTFLGGSEFSNGEQGNGISVDSGNNFYVTGTTRSSDFPTTPGAFQQSRFGFSDAFITKFGARLSSISISGHVIISALFEADRPLSGVTLTLTGSGGFAPRRVVTGSDGAYSFNNLPAGRTYIVTPSKDSFKFTPPRRTYPNVGMNFTGQNFLTHVFSIEGQVLRANGVGVGGVKVTLSGTRNAVTTTNSNGHFSFPDLPEGGTYKVTPMKAGLTFKPASMAFANLNDDKFLNFVPLVSISGRVTGINNTGVGGVTVSLEGLVSTTTRTDSNGDYKFIDLPLGGNYTVTPSKTGLSFSPTGRNFNNLPASQTAANFMAFVTITGKVRLMGTNTGVGGVTMHLTGSRTATRTTNSDGIYTFGNLPVGGDYTVTPSKPGFSFNPPTRTFNDLMVSPAAANTIFNATQ
jgi:photosystem II stability/assembly factor-like uncharacterized protein